jgi:uncharacterized repeat protein (TIGR01451 family)
MRATRLMVRSARSRGVLLLVLSFTVFIAETSVPSAAPMPGLLMTFSKLFNATNIAVGATTQLGFTITNNSGSPVTGLAFTDTLPAGLVVGTPPGVGGTCVSGTITAVAGSGSVSWTGGSLSPLTNCTITLNVTGTTLGVKNNTSGALANSLGPDIPGPSASLSVDGPPVISKAFGVATMAVAASTSLTFTLQNNNPNDVLHGVGFTDTLPAGLVVATPNALSNTCNGTATATAGSTSISLSGGTVFETGSTCTIVVNVTGVSPGLQTNTTGAVTSTEGGTGGTATASITITGAVPMTPTGWLALLTLLVGGTAAWALRRRDAGSSAAH